MVLDEGKTVGAVARELDLTASVLRQWVERVRADRTGGKTGLTTAERESPSPQRVADRPGRARHPKKHHGLLREAEPVRFRFIAAEKARHSVTRLCQVLRVTRGGFYAWCGRGPSAHAQRDGQLQVKARTFFEASRRRYESPRIIRDLQDDGERISRKRVVRLMQEEGLVARKRKRFESTTMSDHDQPFAANLLDRQFAAERPNQRWVGDTTEFVIASGGKLYLAAILDLYSRFNV